MLGSKSVCLHPSEICNGINDCQSGEDEFLCELPAKCPITCQCLLYGINCAHGTLNSALLNVLTEYVFFKLIDVKIYTYGMKNLLQKVHNVFSLTWTSSKLQNICLLNFTSHVLQHIDFSFNEIQDIQPNCFKGTAQIQIILLNHNKLKFLFQSSFSGLQKVIKLDVSCNDLSIIYHQYFTNIEIGLLNISHNKVAFIDTNLVHGLRVNMIVTDDYRVCCLMDSADSDCSTKPQWPQSCNIMLTSVVAKIIIVCEFIMIFLFNFVSLFKHMSNSPYANLCFLLIRLRKSKLKKKYRKLSSFSIVILFVITNDVLFGTHLVVLFCKDLYYGMSYVVYAEEWLKSRGCKVLGFITFFTMLNSLFLLTLAAISRLFVVRFPFNSHFKSVKIFIRYILGGIVCNAGCCIVVAYIYGAVEQNKLMPSPVCIYLGETFKSLTIKNATIGVALLQIFCFIITTIIYLIIIYTLKIQNVTKNVEAEKQVLIQVLLVTATNAICWIPSGVIYLTSIAMETYPTSILMWNVILINPVNSVINPIIFCIIPMVREIGKNRKSF